MTLPAFAAERRAAAPLLLGTGSGCRMMGQTNRQTPGSYIEPACWHIMRLVSIN